MKKIIRLTESDLHRIVKESVNKILSEAVNELDPRTYASYAAKRAAQGQTAKAKQGQQAARDAWNREYGYDGKDHENPWRGYTPNEEGIKSLKMTSFNEPYRVENNHIYNGQHNFATYSPSRDYNWYDDDGGYSTQGKGYQPYYNLGADANGQHHWDYIPWGEKTSNALEVARQMGQGNGKYIKGQGWQ